MLIDRGRRRTVQVFLDTAGWAFSYPLARAAGCRVASYTHYPTVSADMLVQVRRSCCAALRAQPPSRLRSVRTSATWLPMILAA